MKSFGKFWMTLAPNAVFNIKPKPFDRVQRFYSSLCIFYMFNCCRRIDSVKLWKDENQNIRWKIGHHLIILSKILEIRILMKKRMYQFNSIIIKNNKVDIWYQIGRQSNKNTCEVNVFLVVISVNYEFFYPWKFSQGVFRWENDIFLYWIDYPLNLSDFS